MSTTNDPDPLIGRLVAGRYEVLKKLNQGGVGAVYLAMQRPLDRPVALKVLLKKHADDETAIKRFEKEAAAVARLAHAHIVTLYDFGATDSGDMYIAMEFLRGQSLRDLLDAAGFVPWERALHIVQGICRALVAAHTQKIVHRDLKPENVMLVESNGDLDFAKVLDFGLARSIQGQAPAITRHDVIPGTPIYMSPERANGISNDPRSDLYALGALWFELLTGEPPFPGETSIKIILRHIHEQPRAPSSAQPKNAIPPFIDDLVLQLLEKSVERRPPSARHLLDHLDALARPTGWHVGRPQEVGRRGHHDSDLQGFANAASALGSDDMHFAIEEGEPLPLLKKKAPAPAPSATSEEPPVLLLQKKKPTASTSLQALQAQMTPVSGTPSAASLAPPSTSSAPSFAMAAPVAAPLPRAPTEDFLRPALEAAQRAPDPSPTPRAPGKIESLAQVAGWLSTARTARTVGELCCAFLVTRFDRALVIDVRAAIPMVLGSATSLGATLAVPPIVHALPESRGLIELASRREAYYGPALHGPDWMPWFGSLGGGSAPGAMFVGGLQRDGKPAFLFYADHKDITLRPMVKDTVVLLREAAAALSLIG